MSVELLVSVVGGIALPIIIGMFAFLWSIHRDVGDLRERMARLEGRFEGFTGRRDTPPA